MIEEGPESFMQRWSRHAAEGVLFARPEGSPLLEVLLGGVIVQLLERTNPYLGTPGRARLLVQPTTDSVENPPEGDDARWIDVPRRGAMRAQGRVIEREGRLLVVDAGVPLLVDVPGLNGEEGPAPGEGVRFTARPPIHGFVLPRAPGAAAGAQGRDIDEAP